MSGGEVCVSEALESKVFNSHVLLLKKDKPKARITL